MARALSWLLLCLYFGQGQGSVCPTETKFDFIIVGTGTTGSVLANRLSELSNVSVLALEAGGKPLHVSEIPLIAYQTWRSIMDWNYTTVPQKYCCKLLKKQTILMSRGLALGGSSSINAMVYTRGNRQDFDSWEELGNEGWSYKDLFPYFLRMEDYRVPMTRNDAPYHNTDGRGPLSIEVPPFQTPIGRAFLQAGQETGQPLCDLNGEYQTGFTTPPVTTRDGARWGAYRAYLAPIMDIRDNLRVETYAFVTKILFDSSKKAVGVIYEKKGEVCTVTANKEIILSAGAFNSPQLLLLSGIGPKKDLTKLKLSLLQNGGLVTPCGLITVSVGYLYARPSDGHGERSVMSVNRRRTGCRFESGLRRHNEAIPVIQDLPGVGKNYQDHLTILGMVYTFDQPVSLSQQKYYSQKYLDLWEETRTGPMTVPEGFEGVAFYKTNVTEGTDDWPDLELFFSSANIAKDLQILFTTEASPILSKPSANAVSFHPFLLRPKSHGTVSLRSANPRDAPIIDPKYLASDKDVDVMAEGIRIVRELGQTKAFRQYGAKFVNGGMLPACQSALEKGDLEYRRCFVRATTTAAFHPTSTCKMAPETDPLRVVDRKLRVYGVKNLRVADASIMPNVVAAHPQAACMVIGEKIADDIKRDI